MTCVLVSRLRRMVLVSALCVWLGGCAGPLALLGPRNTLPPFRDATMSMQKAGDAIVIGQTTKAQALAALGPATVVQFDSGFEVWVYREKGPETSAGKAEFVILFSPSGVIKKTRMRPAYAAGAE